MAAKRKEVNSEYILGQMEYKSVLTLLMYHISILLKVRVLFKEGEVMYYNGQAQKMGLANIFL